MLDTLNQLLPLAAFILSVITLILNQRDKRKEREREIYLRQLEQAQKKDASLPPRAKRPTR